MFSADLSFYDSTTRGVRLNAFLRMLAILAFARLPAAKLYLRGLSKDSIYAADPNGCSVCVTEEHLQFATLAQPAILH
jgi:hypothetical protein